MTSLIIPLPFVLLNLVWKGRGKNIKIGISRELKKLWFEGLWFGEKIKIWYKIADTSFKYFLWVLLWYVFIWTSWTGSISSSSFTILRCYKDVYMDSFVPRTTRLWNYLAAECFPLTYLYGFEYRVETYDLFEYRVERLCFLVGFPSSFPCNFLPHSGCSALHGVEPK